ncbi:hypothetical protein A3Q56_05378 [Intoshia linei]|uniref:Uncharacterized protein n=1 Tax=Intoshia linei TaxID=1819745 RepID=A0A177AY16_9BILA|nr:hypothetical protein A3Q56_05378 [Intoshia linei]
MQSGLSTEIQNNKNQIPEITTSDNIFKLARNQKNMTQVLSMSSRGISARHRHFLKDLESLFPNFKHDTCTQELVAICTAVRIDIF